MKPLVSAIIPNYNYAIYIGEAVESALRQTYAPIEVVVVDDGSADDSIQVLREFGDRIRVLSQKNAGVAASRNNGVKASKGEFIAFLDADDRWYPDKIAKQAELFQSASDLGLVHVGVQDIDAESRPLEAHLDGMEGRVSEQLLLFDQAVILGGGSGLMVPRTVFDEIGGFDLRLSTSADWDLFYQISSRYRVGFVDELLIGYRLHGSNMHGNIWRMEKEMLIGFEKAFKDPTAANRRQCYGNLHRTLAGSYFRAGEYGQFLRQAMKSMVNRPSNLKYFLEFPLRRMRRV